MKMMKLASAAALAVVPEPASAAAALLGMAGIGLLRRRRPAGRPDGA